MPLRDQKKKFCFHGNVVLVKLQVAYHMSVLGLTFSQANVAGRKYILAERILTPFSIIFLMF